MAFGVDVLGTLTEKLKQLSNETGVHYDSFVELTKRYKQGRITEEHFFSKILSYVVNISALNFLSIRVILELRSAIEKGTSFKDAGGLASSPASGPALGGFGISSFTSASSGKNDDVLQEQQERHLSKHVQESTTSTIDQTKICKVCSALVPAHAKFCRTCGNKQTG
jgi:ribosomal protein L40E